MFIRKHILFPSMLIFASANAVENHNPSEWIQVAASDDALETLKQKAIGKAENYVTDETKNFLSPYLNSLEMSVNARDILTGPSYEIIGLKAYDNNGKQNGYLFNQFGLSHFDKRTTINIGLGYRYLSADEKWLLGANVFYDNEVTYQHTRAGAGIELKSSIFKLAYNHYDGLSGYKDDVDGTTAKALDGSDVRFDLALPYLPGAAISYKNFKWIGDAGGDDIKGSEVSLKGKLSSSFHVDTGRTFYDSATQKDDSWIKLTYQMNLGETKNEPLLFDFSKDAYQLASIAHEKYKPVQRENRIIKQKKFSTTVSGN